MDGRGGILLKYEQVIISRPYLFAGLADSVLGTFLMKGGISMNRRVFSRIKLRFRGELEVKEKSFPASLRDASVNGLLLELGDDAALQPGDRGQFYLFLGDAMATFEVEIVRAQGSDVAVTVVHAEPDELSHLTKLIMYNSKDAEGLLDELNSEAGLMSALSIIFQKYSELLTEDERSEMGLQS